MPTFRYRAKDSSGRTVTGAVDAADEHAAAAMIRESGNLPMDIRAASSRTLASRPRQAGGAVQRHLLYPLWTGVNIRALLLFYRQLATLLNSGMSLSESLRSISRRVGGALGRICREAELAVSRGEQLSGVLERRPQVFSSLQVSLVRAGEMSGMLAAMVDRIASHLEHEIRVRQMLAKAMFYPALVTVVMVVIVAALPHLPQLLTRADGFSYVAVQTGKTLLPPLLALAVIVVVSKLVFQFGGMRMLWDAVKVQPPIVGTAARKIAMSRFSRALALLYSAGLPASEAIGAAADATSNVYLGRRIRQAIPAAEAGHGLTDSLARTGAVMPMVLDMLSTGEKTGSLDAVLEKAADYMDGETDATIQKLGIGVFVGSILVLGAIVLVIVVRFYSGYAASVVGAG